MVSTGWIFIETIKTHPRLCRASLFDEKKRGFINNKITFLKNTYNFLLNLPSLSF
jgi:hypothetical protein